MNPEREGKGKREREEGLGMYIDTDKIYNRCLLYMSFILKKGF